MCLVLVCQGNSDCLQPLKCTRRAQHLAAGTGWSLCWGRLRMRWMVLGWFTAGQPQKSFLSFFLGSLEFAPSRDSEVLRTERLHNLYSSPPATHPLTLHICSARDHLHLLLTITSAQGNLQIASQLITFSIWSNPTWRDSSFEVKYSDLKTCERPQCCWRPAGGCSLPKKTQHRIEILQKTLD